MEEEEFRAVIKHLYLEKWTTAELCWKIKKNCIKKAFLYIYFLPYLLNDTHMCELKRRLNKKIGNCEFLQQ